MNIQPNPQNGVATANKALVYTAIGFVVFLVLACTGLLFPLIALVIFGGGAVGFIWGLGYMIGAFRGSGQPGPIVTEAEPRRVPPFGPTDPFAGSNQSREGHR